MFTIGDFARHGRVSVRMLRHYDAIGLLRPATVDPASGYRFYQAGQLGSMTLRSPGLRELGKAHRHLPAAMAAWGLAHTAEFKRIRRLARPAQRDSNSAQPALRA